MNVSEDYIHFQIENKETLEELKEHETETYELFKPVIAALDFINEIDFKIEGESEQDLIDIFEIGFHYLYDSLEHIKRFKENYFNNDIEELIIFDSNVALYLKLDEVDSLFEETSEKFSKLLDEVQSSFEYKKAIEEERIVSIDEEIYKTLEEMDDNLVSDIFRDICDSLGIELF